MNKTPEPMSDELLNQLESLPEELCGPHELNRAVAEIRRLRANIAELESDGREFMKYEHRVAELEAELSASKSARKGSDGDELLRLLDELDSEVERLVAAVSDVRLDAKKWQDYCEAQRDD